MSSFGEILSEFKKSEEAENIVAIIEDNDLQNGMIAWKSVRIRYKAATDCQEKLRSVRDDLINAIYWRVERNQTQIAGGFTPNDDNTKMLAIYAYLQALRDFPATNPITTQVQYDALVWPTIPT